MRQEHLHRVGPLGLALPVWKPEYTAQKEKAEREVNQRAAEGRHVHGYGGGRTYWDAYYSDPSCFVEAYTREWYCSAEALEAHVKPACPGLLALEFGCGTSMVSAKLEDMGYAVVACDFSAAALQEAGGEGTADLRVIADVCRLPIRHASVDLVVDKATIDTLLCAPAGRDGMVAAYLEAARVLRPGGRLVTVSHTSRKHIIDALALPFVVREERMWNSTAQEATESDAETETEREPDQSRVLAARRRVAQALATLHSKVGTQAQAELKTRCKDAIGSSVTRAGLARLADFAVELCQALPAHEPQPAEVAAGDVGLAGRLIQALEELLLCSSCTDCSYTPLHPAAHMRAHLRRDGAQPHCFVIICEKQGTSRTSAPQSRTSAPQSLEPPGIRVGDGGGGEEEDACLGFALGHLEGVVGEMLADDDGVQSMLKGFLGSLKKDVPEGERAEAAQRDGGVGCVWGGGIARGEGSAEGLSSAMGHMALLMNAMLDDDNSEPHDFLTTLARGL